MLTSTKIAGALLGCATALGTFAGGMGPASAEAGSARVGAKPSIQTFKNQAYGECLSGRYDDVWGLGTCGGWEGYNRWRVKRESKTVQLENFRRGLCLTDGYGGVKMGSCKTPGSSKWRVTYWNDGTIRFKSVATGECLDVADGGNTVGSRTCDKSKSQSWS